MAEAAESDLAPGAKVGEYVVDRKIAEGGMGSVYAGHHPVIGKRVAVKVLAPHCASIPDLVRRFVEEARATNKIGHPNIIDIFSFGTLADARPFFVMEFLDGASLAQRMDAGDMTATETRRILRQICSALEAAHRAGIIHRDLKPENIWIAAPAHEDSYAKVLDFGIAKLLDNPAGKSTQTGAAMGTPRYMAPEQCMGRAVDARADIYSLGIILYEMFAGVVPFRGETFGELIYQQMSEKPEPPSKHRPMEPELERLILMCLEKDPAKRPESAKDLSRLLEVALHDGDKPITQPRTAALTAQAAPVPVTTMSQSIGQVLVTAPPATTPKRAGLVIGATALVVLVGGAMLSRTRRASPPPEPPSTMSPVPGAAAPAPPTTGRLQLRVEGGPADKVSLDGKEVARATSAVDFGEVALGAHFVTIEAAGRDPQNTPVTVAAGAPTALSVVLKPAEAPQPTPHGASRRTTAHAPTSGHPASAAESPTTPALPAPVRRTRAEEHGLMDQNPFRKP
ncbi:MAG TPA: serine/threonine-protein kinase [Polyangia bacterium]